MCSLCAHLARPDQARFRSRASPGLEFLLSQLLGCGEARVCSVSPGGPRLWDEPESRRSHRELDNQCDNVFCGPLVPSTQIGVFVEDACVQNTLWHRERACSAFVGKRLSECVFYLYMEVRDEGSGAS